MFTPFAFIKTEAAAPAATYVTSGLQLYVDANNATSYPGTGNTWYDLSGNGRDLTINASQYTNGGGSFYYMDFTAGLAPAAQYVSGGTILTLPTGSDGKWTMCTNAAWYNSSGTYRNGARCKNPSSNAWQDYIIMTNAGTNDLGAYTDRAGFVDSGFNVNDLPSYSTQFNYQVWELRSATGGSPYYQYWYQADLTNAAGTITNSDTSILTGPSMFGAREDGAFRALKMGYIMCYDRGLTAAEKQQNYDYFKATYGV